MPRQSPSTRPRTSSLAQGEIPSDRGGLRAVRLEAKTRQDATSANDGGRRTDLGWTVRVAVANRRSE